jgi:hypothetical protein
MWSSITAAVKSKMAVESKATHMGPEGYYGTEGYAKTVEITEAETLQRLLLHVGCGWCG